MEGQYKILRATYVSDKAEKAQLLADARKVFEDIRPQFEKAWKASVNLLKSLPRNTSPRKVFEAKTMVGENRLTVAMVDFYLAQTQAEALCAPSAEQIDQGVRRHLPGLPRGSGHPPGLHRLEGPLLPRPYSSGTREFQGG